MAGAGRIGGLELAREFVAVIASLNGEGAEVTVDAVAARLGKTRAEAEALVDQLYAVSTNPEESIYLPVYEDEDGSVKVESRAGAPGRALRLTPQETAAVRCALSWLGVPEDDPLARQMAEQLAAGNFDRTSVERILAPAGDGADEEARAACARAMAEASAVEFAYRKCGSSAEECRHVVPRSFDPNDGAWLLVGFDLDRRGERRFRLDRMSDVRLTGPAPAASGATQGEKDAGPAFHTVTLTFDDAHWVELLPWHDLSPVRGRDLTYHTPWYGGNWLPRMLAACGGHAVTDDTELADAARQVAASYL